LSATLIKLQESPIALPTKRCMKVRGVQGSDLGHGKIDRDGTMDNPQPSSEGIRDPMGKVQRLNGSGPMRKYWL